MPLPSDQRPLSVWELTSQLKDLLEGAFPAVWVAGEISNFNRSQSGHCYLTLKDDRAQLRAVMWRGVAVRTRFDLHDGLEVICRGHIDVYAARGSYQLVIGDIVPRGMGALELALRQLREKLAREGLFDAARKRPLPAFVRRIAVVTSPTGAAIRDFLQVLGRRWRGADVLVVPVRVQGDGAAAEIAAAIETVNRLPAAGKGDSPQLCEAPSGPFRQMGTVPFFRLEAELAEPVFDVLFQERHGRTLRG
ncbi:MAG: exodeoxyribonuclease VII large subunit, partial [Thermoguttaceae bacterium]